MKKPTCGCDEYRRVSRRSFMRLSGAAAASLSLPSWLPRVVLAQSDDSDRDIIVSIFLRGGADGLSLCVPFGDDDYYALRPSIAIPRPDSGGASRAIDLDGFFGLPRAMESLIDVYRNDDLLVVHACGLENPTKSHFEAMHFVEVGEGNPSPLMFTGWLGRHLASTAPMKAAASVRGIGIGYGLQRTLVGGPRTMPIEDLANFGFAGDPSSERGRLAALEQMYASRSGPFQNGARETIGTLELLERIDFDDYRPSDSAQYPDGGFGYALRTSAALIKADIGVEALAIDLPGWDTHEYQGPQQGYMSRLMQQLGEGLAAFHADLNGSNRANVSTIVMSEFGRNAFENGSQGTDHGHASAMLVLGNHIAGGRVFADWPGLGNDRLYVAQDLAITTDYRDVIAEVIEKRAGGHVGSLFPDSSYRRKVLGIVE
jgi:uncharacterized protein (DUF1501 family)